MDTFLPPPLPPFTLLLLLIPTPLSPPPLCYPAPLPFQPPSLLCLPPPPCRPRPPLPPILSPRLLPAPPVHGQDNGVYTRNVSNAWVQSFPAGSFHSGHCVTVHFPSPLLFFFLSFCYFQTTPTNKYPQLLLHSRSHISFLFFCNTMLSVPLKQKPLTISTGSSCPSTSEEPDCK